MPNALTKTVVLFTALAALLSSAWAGGYQENVDVVDTALIVAVDVSQSVDEQRYRMQMEGIAQALEDPDVIATITNGLNGRILFSMIAWSDSAEQILPWRTIASKEDALQTANIVRALPHVSGEFTCLARMLRHVARRVIPDIPMRALRTVLDVSGDGIENCSTKESVQEHRDEVLALPATINGLPIIVEGENDVVGGGAYRAPGYGLRELSRQPDKETTTLDQWYKDYIIGGPASFLMVAKGYEDFARALRRKFIIEISSTGQCMTSPCRIAGCSILAEQHFALCKM